MTRTVSVTGPGADSLNIDRNTTTFPATAFPVGAGGNLTLSGVTVTGAGAGLYFFSEGSATVTNSTLSGNCYGLFLAGGNATVTNSTLHTTPSWPVLPLRPRRTRPPRNRPTMGARDGDHRTLSGQWPAPLDGLATVTNSTLSGNTSGLSSWRPRR